MTPAGQESQELMLNTQVRRSDKVTELLTGSPW